MSVQVFLVEYLGIPRNHHAIFVELDPRKGTGQLLHVTGSVQTGMEFQSKTLDRKPETSSSFVTKRLLGTASVSNLSYIEDVCRSNPPPAKQFNGPKKIDKKAPLRRCQQWTAETIARLEYEGLILRSTGSSSHASSHAAHSTGGSASRSGGSSSHTSSTGRSTYADGQTSSDGYWTWSGKYEDWYHVSSDGSTKWASEMKGKRRA